MIEIRELSHSFLEKRLFHNVSLRLFPHQRYCVVGANGSGKSTLLKIMVGELSADQGEIDIQNALSIFRIGQDHNLNDDEAIIQTAMMGQEQVYRALVRKDEILAQGDDGAKLAHEISQLEEIIRLKEGYRLRARAQRILEGLGIDTAAHDQELKTLSGGYKWRVFLAQALIKNPDVLMLDEPTNHLDIVSIRWLEQFLCGYKGMVILVSHDKRFMDHVCTQILDIDFDTITLYAGNYSDFEDRRRLFLLQKEKEIQAQEKEMAKKQAFIDRFRYKASKARQAQSRIKQLEKIEIIEPVKSSRIHPKFLFELSEPGSKEILSVRDLSKSYGEKTILSHLSFDVKRGDKIAIIGPNGSGKSTLIKALAQEFPECRKAIRWGYGASLGYFAQDCGKKIHAFDKSALEWLWQFCADKPQSFIQGMLGRVLFTGDDAKKKTKSLSGGELARLNLSYLMIKRPNVLLMDEPTNHLDLESIESLTKALAEYKGTLLVVSHDRNFINDIAGRIIEISPQGIDNYLGSYGEFVESKSRDYLDAVSESKQKKGDDQLRPESKNSYEEQKQRRSSIQKLKKRLDQTMLAVEEVEQQIAAIDELFSDNGFFQENHHTRIAELDQERASLKREQDRLLEVWEESEAKLKELEDEDG